jgi:hypothetical protein
MEVWRLEDGTDYYGNWKRHKHKGTKKVLIRHVNRMQIFRSMGKPKPEVAKWSLSIDWSWLSIVSTSWYSTSWKNRTDPEQGGIIFIRNVNRNCTQKAEQQWTLKTSDALHWWSFFFFFVVPRDFKNFRHSSLLKHSCISLLLLNE